MRNEIQTEKYVLKGKTRNSKLTYYILILHPGMYMRKAEG